jgi:HTH-type transcriptional regulator / antitoxin HipB
MKNDFNILGRSARDIGNAIREARKAKRLTQKQLSAMSGVWQETISKIENGVGGTRLDTILDLFAALDLEFQIRGRSKNSNASIEDIF